MQDYVKIVNPMTKKRDSNTTIILIDMNFVLQTQI